MKSTVVIFGAPSDADPLEKRLAQLHYRTVRATHWAVCQNVFSRGGPVAALVSDTIVDPFALCATLPRDLPKILIADDRSFETRRAAARAGVDAIIPRPVDLHQLLDWLEQFEDRQSTKPISVMMIDDDILLAETYGEALRMEGMIVETIINPADAIRALENAVPDLILMDVQMPGVDGIELARMIRQSRRYLSVPIVFLSGEPDEDRRMAARRSGGDDFISKPVDLDKLVAVVRLRAERARVLRLVIERDSLTGLLNHGHFKDRACAELQRYRRLGVDSSLAMVDIDHFKTINDRFGHPVGDRVIRTLSRALLAAVQGGTVGRCGGEEFGILLPGCGPRAAQAVLDRAREDFHAARFDEGSTSFAVSFSAGVAGDQTLSLQNLIRAADDALYVAKIKGRNRVELARDPPRRDCSPKAAIPQHQTT